MTVQTKDIVISNARVNNLKNVSVRIPRNTLTVITGVSGSGKSSLAFDTLYAEGQRRFVESLSSYARQFLERKNKPDVDSITGLPPAIAIEQKTLSRNPRSTVGTTTEVYDYLRLLFGRIGATKCKNCGRSVRKDTPQSVTQEVNGWNEGDRIYIMFALPPTNESLQAELDKCISLGFTRVMNLNTFDIIDVQEESLPKGLALADVLVVSDRLILRHHEETQSRVFDSIDSSFRYGAGKIVIRNVTEGASYFYSNKHECAYDGTEYLEPEPRLFSFNSPFGACPTCQGFGRSIGIDEDLVIPDKTKSLRAGAVHPFKIQYTSNLQSEMLASAKANGIPADAPVASFTEEQLQWLWHGAGSFTGISGYFKELEEKSYKVQNRIISAKYRGYTRCNVCNGSRLRTSARQVYIGDMNIPTLVKMTIDDACVYFAELKLTAYQEGIASQLLKEIRWRLQLLVDIGVGYLTLDRLSHTLSGGESQRLNLATSLGSSLVGTLYVLDEPSIGLHPRDTYRLINIMHRLRNLGNTVVVVEHDPDIIKSADRVIDIGPKAGELGGEVMFNDIIANIYESETSLTGEYLSGRKNIEVPKKRRKGNGEHVKLIGAREHNVDIPELDIPLGTMTVVTGVSGSGKSTLIHDILYANLKRHFGGFNGVVGKCEEVIGLNNIDDVEMIDQSPIGRSSRSTPVTYTKAFDAIRDVFAMTQSAKQLGWKAGHFSFNVPGGRCETCEGSGTVVVEMQFLPDIELECEVCHGSRYKREAIGIHYKGKSIVDVLSMTIDEAAEFFKGTKKVTDRLRILQDVGLGYLRLGQSSSLLSGGEAQRIKLATHLDTDKVGKVLYIFDEPTTGLHMDDIAKLLQCFQRLVENGHTVLIIEHNVSIIAAADWIIDLGPEAGFGGGKIVCVGTPEAVAKNNSSYTGKALKPLFGKTEKAKKIVSTGV
ncbi:MAG: excinuclease ABC subunit UvrA [Candidatus Kapaibacterium sp.]